MKAPQIQDGTTVSYDLGTLSSLPLSTAHQRLISDAATRCGGRPEWRQRKVCEAEDLARLAQLSGRMVLLALDLSVDLRCRIHLDVPVPCMPQPDGPLQVAPAAHLGLLYREAAMVQSLPGYSFVQIIGPQNVFHPNCDTTHQLICLGGTLPRGLPAIEVILLSYMALAMISTQYDPSDAAGVLNPAACEYFQRRPELLPLSREPFLRRSAASQT